MILQLDQNRIIKNSLTYNEYKQLFIEKVELTDIELLTEDEKNLYEYTKLNLHRSNRIEKTYTVSDELVSILKSINEKQMWMVITENWCGDSAQNLLYIAKIAELNSNISLRIILRDSNLDIMDLYLTNGSRSIPKLVSFNENIEEMFIWGPRPSEAQQLVLQLKSDNLSKEEINQKLHLWYGRDKGKTIENELKVLLNKIINYA